MSNIRPICNSWQRYTGKLKPRCNGGRGCAMCEKKYEEYHKDAKAAEEKLAAQAKAETEARFAYRDKVKKGKEAARKAAQPSKKGKKK
jgi:hypothetical protein